VGNENKLVAETWQEVNAFVQPFEEAWQNGGNPPLDAYLPKDGSIRLRLLVLKELVEVDLERRRQAGKLARREDYLMRYPELAAVDDDGSKKATVPYGKGPFDNPAPAGLVPPFVLGQYQIEAKIGQGGMGMVFRALHARLKKPVAIKILPPDYTADASSVARFHREMEAIGRLDHHNIVRATDAGEAGGVHFLVMELVEGIDLSRLIQLHGPLSVAEACDLVLQAANGLQCAHEHGLVHRDIKPSNLLLSVKGELKILDMGLALLSRTGPDSSVLTGSGVAMGTADYMAPEQWQASHAVDIRADIYSLGCTLYTLLVGRPPFGAPEYKSAPQKMTAHFQEPVKPIGNQRRDVPMAVEDLLQRMTAKKAADRPATPAKVAEALRPFSARANLVGLVRDALERSRASRKLTPQIGAGDALTISRLSTADVSTSPAAQTHRISRRLTRRLKATALLAVLALVLVAVIRPWSGEKNPGDQQKPSNVLAAAQITEAAKYPPGKWHNLLEQPPIPVLWASKKNGSRWDYDVAQKLVIATCLDGQGLLKLGEAPPGRYDLEIDVSQDLRPGGFGLFFRGRDLSGGKGPYVRTDVLVLVDLAGIQDGKLQFRRMALNVYPNDQKPDGMWIPAYDTIPRQSSRNRLKITVGAKGLEKVHWNNLRVAVKLCDPASGSEFRPGAEGAFGIYMQDGNATIHAARLLFHSSPGENR